MKEHLAPGQKAHCSQHLGILPMLPGDSCQHSSCLAWQYCAGPFSPARLRQGRCTASSALLLLLLPCQWSEPAFTMLCGFSCPWSGKDLAARR